MDRDLDQLSQELRDTILQLHSHTGGHLGSALSIVEILTVVLGKHVEWPTTALTGDRFVLSKGHAAMAFYCWLSQRGWLSVEELMTFGSDGSRLEPHPNEKLLQWVHASTGSLGQGLSIGIGFAVGERLLRGAGKVFVVIGDGEANEGQIWEAARAASHLHLDNLIVILDDNEMQQDGSTASIMPVSDLANAWKEMGWLVASCDGHNTASLDAAISELLGTPAQRPRLLHARTIKGYGVQFLAGRAESHYPSPLSVDDLQLVRYLRHRGDLHVFA